MSNPIRVGLIQAAIANHGDCRVTREAAVELHLSLLEKAARQGVQVVCLQELFFAPYFCAEQDDKWFELAEPVPDGPTLRLLRAVARRHAIVIVAPVFEEAGLGLYYNTAAVIDADGSYLGRYRKHHVPHCGPGFWEKYYFTPGDGGYPVFDTRYGRVGVYLCYDRHFPEAARAIGLGGADLVFNPSATVASHAEYLWKLEQPAHAVANQYFVAAINRVGVEDPWRFGEFFGSSYLCDPRGRIVEEGSRSETQVVVADLDLSQIREVRQQWAFFRDRRPESYGSLGERAPVAA